MKAVLTNKRGCLIGLTFAVLSFVVAVPGAGARSTTKPHIPAHTFIDLAAAVATDLGSPAFNTAFGTQNVGNWAAQLFRYAPGPLNASTVPGPFKVTPYLATGFTRQSDGSYIFNLRKGVKSAAGNTFTSADVVYSVKRWLAVDFGNPLLFRLAGIDPNNPITVLGPYQVKVNTLYKSAGTVQLFANIRNEIFDSKDMLAHATTTDPWSAQYLATHSASFGAYDVTGFQPGTAIELKTNPNFFGPKPYFDQIIIKAIPDPSVRLQLVETGYASHTYGIDWTLFKSASDNAKKDGLTVGLIPAVRIDAVFMNERLPQFKNPLVRQAVAMAVDRNAIVKAIYQGFGEPATSPWFNTIPIFAKGPTFDTNVAQAKQLLTQAGYPNGFNITLAGSPGQTGSWIPDELALVQSQLAQIGINATIQTMDPAPFAAGRRAGTIDAAVATLGAGSSDPATVLGQTYSANGPQAVDQWLNPKFEALLGALGGTPAGPRYNRIMTSLLKILHDDPPVAPIMYLPTQVVSDGTIQGWAAYAYPLAYYEHLHR